MAVSVGDLAAGVFAARFCSAIASAQSVAAAVEQGRVSVDAAGLGEGWKVEAVTREGVDLRQLILVQPRGPEDVSLVVSWTPASAHPLGRRGELRYAWHDGREA